MIWVGNARCPVVIASVHYSSIRYVLFIYFPWFKVVLKKDFPGVCLILKWKIEYDIMSFPLEVNPGAHLIVFLVTWVRTRAELKISRNFERGKCSMYGYQWWHFFFLHYSETFRRPHKNAYHSNGSS